MDELRAHNLPDLIQGTDGHPECLDCGRVIWSDPKLAAAAIIPFDNGIVLVQRAIEPAVGKWSFPSGYVNRGEIVEKAIEREALEECALQVSVVKLIGLYSEQNNPVVLAVYEANVIGGTLQSADDETLDVRVFPVNKLPDLAFEHDQRILTDWLISQDV